MTKRLLDATKKGEVVRLDEKLPKRLTFTVFTTPKVGRVPTCRILSREVIPDTEQVDGFSRNKTESKW